MYNRLFTKILDSSIWLEDVTTRIVWITLLAAMDEDGYAHFSAIENLALRARVTVEEAQLALGRLMSPDPNSENPANEGRRVERVQGGFLVINATEHRKTMNREIRREQTRLRVARHREKQKSNVADVTGALRSVTSASASASSSVQKGSAEGKPKVTFPNGIPDSEWLEQLCHDPTYQGIDVKREYGKMVNWCKTKGATPTRRRFVNWLNRAEKPMTAPTRQDYPKDWSESKIREYEAARKKYG